MERVICFRCDKLKKSILKMPKRMLKHKKTYDLIKVNGVVSTMRTFFNTEKKYVLN